MSDFSLNKFLFGPLDVEFCFYYYILSVINYVIMVVFIIYLGYSLLLGNKKVTNYSIIMQGIFGTAILYFQNRLLHSMCIKADNHNNIPREHYQNNMY